MHLRTMVAILVVTALVSLVPTGQARVDGPCTIIVEDVDVSDPGARVEMPADKVVSYRVEAPSDIEAVHVILEYGPVERDVYTQPYAAGTRSAEGTVGLERLVKVGTGLYEVRAEVDLAEGSCTGELELKVPGSAWQRPVGIAATAVLGAAGVALLLLLLKTILDAKDILDTIRDVVKEARSVVPQAAPAAVAAPGPAAPAAPAEPVAAEPTPPEPGDADAPDSPDDYPKHGL